MEGTILWGVVILKTMSNIYMDLPSKIFIWSLCDVWFYLHVLKTLWNSNDFLLIYNITIPCLYSKKCYWNDWNTGFCEWVCCLEKWCGQRKSSRFIGWSCFPYWSGEKQVISPFDCKLVDGQSLILLVTYVNCVYFQRHHGRLWPAPVLLPT